jgi:hypothetical protein
MPLTDDQRAMLQLLLRGQSYSDLGSLLGLDEDEVRSRASTAMAEIGGENPDRDVSLTDYLLGQADPIGRADAARQLQNDAGARDLAEQLATQLRLLVPGADLPDLPGEGAAPAKRKEPAAPAAAAEAAPPNATGPARRAFSDFATDLTRGRRQVIAGLIGAGVLVVVGLLAILGVFSGGGGGGGGDSSNTTTSSSQQASNASGLTRAVLTGQNGSQARGVAVFARVRNVPVMEINVAHLDPSPAGKGYVVWLYGSNTSAFPLTSAPQKEKNGQLRGAVPVAAQLIQALQQGLLTDVDVSLVSQSQITASLKAARTSQKFPHYEGTSVVRGKITGPGANGGASGGSGASG